MRPPFRKTQRCEVAIDTRWAGADEVCQAACLANALGLPPLDAVLLLSGLGWNAYTRTGDTNDYCAFILSRLGWRTLDAAGWRVEQCVAPLAVLQTEDHTLVCRGGVLIDTRDSRGEVVQSVMLPPG